MIKIKDIMTPRVVTVSKSSKVSEAAATMAKKRLSCLVVTENDKPVGVFTERDMVREIVVPEKDPEKTKVGDIMNTHLESIDPSTNFLDAVKIMKTKHVRRLCVIDKGKISGIITETDIVNATIKLETDLVEKLAKVNLSVKDYQKEYKELQKLKEIKNLYKKVDTGSEDLNKVIDGGFPTGANIMVEGVPGAGKSVIGLTYLYQGIKEGDTCVYLYSKETIDDIKNGFKSVGYDVPTLDKNKDFFFIHIGQNETKNTKNMFNINTDDLNMILETLDNIITKSKAPVRCVINIISELMMLWKPQTVYQFIAKLTENLKTSKVTTIFLIEEGMHEEKDIISMEQLMDGVIKLMTEEEGMKIEKKMIVKRMGTGFTAPDKPFDISFEKKKGIVVKN